MTLAATLLIVAAACTGLLEGVRWNDLEPEWKVPRDYYHAVWGIAAICLALLAKLPPVPWGEWIGALLLGFAFRELAMDTVSAIHRGHRWTFLFRWRKQNLYSLQRYPLIERLTALILGGYLVR